MYNPRKRAFFQATVYRGPEESPSTLNVECINQSVSSDNLRSLIFSEVPDATDYTLNKLTRKQLKKLQKEELIFKLSTTLLSAFLIHDQIKAKGEYYGR